MVWDVASIVSNTILWLCCSYYITSTKYSIYSHNLLLYKHNIKGYQSYVKTRDMVSMIYSDSDTFNSTNISVLWWGRCTIYVTYFTMPNLSRRSTCTFTTESRSNNFVFERFLITHHIFITFWIIDYFKDYF